MRAHCDMHFAYHRNPFTVCHQRGGGWQRTAVFHKAGANRAGECGLRDCPGRDGMGEGYAQPHVGVPQALRIGCDSFNNESKIQEYFKRNNLFREQEKIKTDNFKYLLVVSELIKIYKCKFRIQKHLDYILIPDIQIGKNDVEIECLDEIEKERIFEKVCFTPFDESFRSDWICFTSNNILNKIRFRRERWHDIRELQFVKVKYGTEVEVEFITSRIMEFLNESKGENVYV